ncbi:1-(5-phosphoribosyl)-5-amino-4-imidazole-carboxylate carboxylase [candidate division MSBL1 archaeon SCGC-AAA259J03]|uniref:1-(5-phosphoribosyl)-5-amino-4-imidazole-carboxylate carboxylase n=1 Tax=candidate division MSBL1 archaeon SCGC-AAA259J03 TaxID=1698269 RepID=A0A656YV69_9EURY|nr:1-(5-phosphoribosyl)-5-amino-4-imidazole-carboxylate carboxylase [candidate division MSBL1 archaeon SCGC-AAA259J03]
MEKLRSLLEKVKNGEMEIERALEELKFLPYKDLGHSKLDTHREIRRGFPEAILCEGKTKKQLLDILKEFPEDQTVIATRASEDTYKYIKNEIDDAVYHKKARIIQIGRSKRERKGSISVVSAGTSDEQVAEESAITAEVMGNEVKRIYDVGISGVHRLLLNLESIRESSAAIVAAGMEGALPGLVAGLVSIPVIGVPTSVGYGTNLNGLAPLFTMLNSCAAGVAVVNIDNGYGAAYIASLIAGGKDG